MQATRISLLRLHEAGSSGEGGTAHEERGKEGGRDQNEMRLIFLSTRGGRRGRGRGSQGASGHECGDDDSRMLSRRLSDAGSFTVQTTTCANLILQSIMSVKYGYYVCVCVGHIYKLANSN